MQTEQLIAAEYEGKEVAPNWVTNASVLWVHRGVLGRTAAVALLLALVIALVIPNKYESTARIMPPETAGGTTALLAAIAGRSEFGGLGGLASSLLGARSSGPLFVDLLRSATVSGDLIDRFQLQKIYQETLPRRRGETAGAKYGRSRGQEERSYLHHRRGFGPTPRARSGTSVPG